MTKKLVNTTEAEVIASAKDSAKDQDTNLAEMLGEKLRDIRNKRGWSLQDVEKQSEKVFRSSALGAYERGERMLSYAKFLKLAQVYRVSPETLLPNDNADIDLTKSTLPTTIAIDLTKLDQLNDTGAKVLKRYIKNIQTKRGDFNANIITMRQSDVEMLAAALGHEQIKFLELLDTLNLRVLTQV
jgi:transcriptional regulator with XRE-family HTH domain